MSSSSSVCHTTSRTIAFIFRSISTLFRAASISSLVIVAAASAINSLLWKKEIRNLLGLIYKPFSVMSFMKIRNEIYGYVV